MRVRVVSPLLFAAGLVASIGCSGGPTAASKGGGGGGGQPPDVLEDFSTYTSNANFISDPRGMYVSATDEPAGGGPDGNGWQFLLDQSVGLNIDGYSLSQSMRYDQADLTAAGGSGTTGRCTDHTVDRGLKVGGAEVWVEVYIMFSSNYNVVAPSGWGCSSGQEYKLFFGGVNSVSRFNLEMQPNRWIFGYPTNETAQAVTSPVPSNWWDGKWHQYRFHLKLGQGNGEAAVWYDGVLGADLTGINTGSNSTVDELYLGVNLNQGPGQTQHIWWGRIAAWYTDPGW